MLALLARVFVPHDLDPKINGFQDSWWNISVLSLVILAAVVFEISCKNRQTDKCTYRQTNAGENPTPATNIGMGNNSVTDISFHSCFLRAEVQPTLDPSAETFISVQCTNPGKGGELVCVCGARCVGWRKEQ